MSLEIETPVSADFPFPPETEKSFGAPARFLLSFHPHNLSDEAVGPYDFTNPDRLLPIQLKRFKRHQEEFAAKMASRFSNQLHADCVFKVASIEVFPGRSLSRIRPASGHLALFKIESLRGIALVEFSLALGSGMIDQMLGGQGVGSNEVNNLSDLEIALFEQITCSFMAEWCAHWTAHAELKPVLLGYESNGRFRQVAAPQAEMIAITFSVQFGSCSGEIFLGLPFAPLEPFIKKLNTVPAAKNIFAAASIPSTQPKPQLVTQWRDSFAEVPVALTAEWNGVELAARDVLALKAGDVLRIGEDCMQAIHIRLADELKFQGRPGTIAGQWAVELTQLIA